MGFLILLSLSAAAIAASAAFFSVWGLAQLFSGIFWSVVIMGSSLEAGKLMAASFLYRYWDKTNAWMKTYLMLGVAALMMLTSTGIYGVLSAGYQQDALPLKQKQEQVRLLEDEKVRALARKLQIDAALSGGPQLNNLQSGKDGRIDPNAARVLRETNRGRDTVVRQYKAEQTDVNGRVKELDVQLLALKQELIQVEAHTGPITYIAKSFGVDSDNATKYLILLIIFAFDPMAVALTLAVNIALRLRKEEQEAKRKFNEVSIHAVTDDEPIVEPKEVVEEPLVERIEVDQPLPEADPEPEVEPEAIEEQPVELSLVPIEEPQLPPTTSLQPLPATHRRVRPYAQLQGSEAPSADKIRELVNHRQWFMNRQRNGEILSKDEQWEIESIDNILSQYGYSHYIT